MKIRTLLTVSCVAAVLGVCASVTSVGTLPNNHGALSTSVTVPTSTIFLNGGNLMNGGNFINGAQPNNRHALINGPVLPSGISAPPNPTLALMGLAARPLARKD